MQDFVGMSIGDRYYKQDLAFIHDVGFPDYALKSAPGILAILAQHNIHKGLIVDLGCSSGLSAQEFTKAGYDGMTNYITNVYIQQQKLLINSIILAFR